MFDSIFKALIAKISRFIFIKQVTGLDNIPRGKGLIIASNHTSYMDIWALLVVFYLKEKRYIRFLAKKELLKGQHVKILSKLFESPLTRPIYFDDNSSRKEVYGECIKALKKGQVIGIFPEGGRSPNGKISKGKTGMVRLSVLAKVPIVPIGINGAFEIMPKGKNIPKFKKIITLNIGKPIYPDRYNKKMNNISIKRDTKIIMRRIAELIGQKYNY